MANHFNHHRTRKRSYEFARLSASILPQLKQIPNGASFQRRWRVRGETILERRFTITNQALRVEGGQAEYLIPLENTQLTYGEHLWYRCPACNRRCGVLYHAGLFACRQCVKATYQSQNGSITDALADRIREKRQKLWPEMDSYMINDTLEGCQWWWRPLNYPLI